MNRYLWVWSTFDTIQNSVAVFKECERTGINNLILYTPTSLFSEKLKDLKSFIGTASKNGIRCWGMDGYRGYLDDNEGPEQLYEAAKAMVAFNGMVNDFERFVGFHTDVEPADQHNNENLPLHSFHNGVAQSKLHKTGHGKWKTSQYDDRHSLMVSWLNMHTELKKILNPKMLLLSVALPTWLDDYFEEPICALYDNKDLCVVEHFMDIADEICFMSYNTNPNNVINRLEPKLKLAPPHLKIMASVETCKGVEEYVSYADTKNKQCRKVVLQDIAMTEAALKAYPSFGGFCIHDYDGWKELPETQ